MASTVMPLNTSKDLSLTLGETAEVPVGVFLSGAEEDTVFKIRKLGERTG
jgi:hypothetical protein